ncbi:MAG: transposase family protein [Pseudoalteromonas sp.]|nr:transposase family protein [Pseudoalteromonas sp.]
MEMMMNIENLNTVKDLKSFLDDGLAIAYIAPKDKVALYQLIQKILVNFRYITCSKKDKGVITCFLLKVTGYSRQQLVRLICQYKKTGYVKYRPANNGFSKKYTLQDIRLLAKVDERHDTPCGHAIKKLCERAYEVFDEAEYQNLAKISVSHLYNLRASKTYKNQRTNFTKTKPRQIAIAERRKPQSNGEPGFIRIDTVHQGDLDKRKGVYHINAVDETTQFEVMLSVEKISEKFLLPILEQILEKFPFVIKGFHSDNGSEFINQHVLKLLNKLFIEFTKSRSRHSNDNALAESKNASIVRKQFGYQHIPQKWATRLNEFNLDYLYPYINFHRPCFFCEIETDEKGKQRKIYKYENMMTPYDKLKSLPDANKYLKPEMSFDILDKLAMKMTDNQAAETLKKERQILFNQIFEQKKLA